MLQNMVFGNWNTTQADVPKEKEKLVLKEGQKEEEEEEEEGGEEEEEEDKQEEEDKGPDGSFNMTVRNSLNEVACLLEPHQPPGPGQGVREEEGVDQDHLRQVRDPPAGKHHGRKVVAFF